MLPYIHIVNPVLKQLSAALVLFGGPLLLKSFAGRHNDRRQPFALTELLKRDRQLCDIVIAFEALRQPRESAILVEMI
jgi:hypothetical protein